MIRPDPVARTTGQSGTLTVGGAGGGTVNFWCRAAVYPHWMHQPLSAAVRMLCPQRGHTQGWYKIEEEPTAAAGLWVSVSRRASRRPSCGGNGVWSDGEQLGDAPGVAGWGGVSKTVGRL